MDSFRVAIGSLIAGLSSNDESFLRYARAHFKPVVVPGESVPALDAIFDRGPAGSRGETPDRKLGRGLFAGERSVVWRDIPYFPGFSLELEAGEPFVARMGRYLPPSPRGRLRTFAELARGGRARRNQWYFELLYWLLYYPAFWLLRKRGVQVMHGGGIEVEGTGVVLAGAQGTGKSTLAAHLLPMDGVRFLSDNIVLSDGERVYSCHEPVRFDRRLAEEVPGLASCLERVDLAVPLGRAAFVVAAGRTTASMKADVVLVPSMWKGPTTLSPIAVEDCIERIERINLLAEEVRMYDVFAAVASTLRRDPRDERAARSSLERLLGAARCYDLTIRRGEPPAETARIILDLARGAR